MKKQQEIKRYAKMFINAVGLDGTAQAVNELQSVNDLMSKSKAFRMLLENPLFTGKEREKALKEISKRVKLSDNTVRLVVHLSEQRIISNLSGLIMSATAIYLEKKKRTKAVVTTPVEISSRYNDRLKTSLKNLTGRDVDIEYIVSPALLGGMLIKVGSTMYDSSIKGQLRLLKDDLMKG